MRELEYGLYHKYMYFVIKLLSLTIVMGFGLTVVFFYIRYSLQNS